MTVFKDHFSKLAAQYSAFRPTYPEVLFDYLAGLCGRQDNAWDCACGSGQATASLAQRFREVLGTDASAQQVAAAPARANVTYRVAPAERSGLAADSTDLVTVAQALHWFDVPVFFAEVQRVLRPSGVVAVLTYGVLHVEGAGVDALIQEFYYDIVGPYWPPERALVEEGYRSIVFPFSELVPPAFSMQERWELPHVMGYLRSWSATARYVEHTGRDPVQSLEERLQPIWGDAGQQRLVTWPLALRVGRKP